jgi:hypothetical protein
MLSEAKGVGLGQENPITPVSTLEAPQPQRAARLAVRRVLLMAHGYARAGEIFLAGGSSLTRPQRRGYQDDGETAWAGARSCWGAEVDGAVVDDEHAARREGELEHGGTSVERLRAQLGRPP